VTKKSKKAILAIIATLVIAGCAVVYYLWNKPHKDVVHANAIKVVATALYNTFSTDSIKANMLYTNKIVAVSGEVIQVSKNQQNQQVILLKTAIVNAAVNCTMEENAGDVKQGNSVIIKGICSGYIAGDAGMDLPGDVFVVRGYHLK
jgi:flagellar basal body-associated protein FliL